nr:ATP-binding cassette domain-containing protein [Exiguobacterium sp. TNDT2]
MSGFKRFQEALAWTPERRGGEPVALQGAVTFDHVAFQYETGRPVLRDVHVDVRPGEYVAIVGASGVGKTTLASLLSAFYHPGAGELKYDGVSQHVLDLHVLRRQIAVVQQDVHLFSGTILDNIRYGSEAGQEEIEAAARLANADEFIRAFRKGYATEVGPRGVKLSGGQKQRISIARAFLKNPAILVLDEATSALDQQSERAVQAALETLTTGRTTFVIAHRLSTIQAAGRILVMKDGRIVEEGPHGELMKRAGAYADLYRSVAIV